MHLEIKDQYDNMRLVGAIEGDGTNWSCIPLNEGLFVVFIPNPSRVMVRGEGSGRPYAIADLPQPRNGAVVRKVLEGTNPVFSLEITRSE
jgi:hypothetical protein